MNNKLKNLLPPKLHQNCTISLKVAAICRLELFLVIFDLESLFKVWTKVGNLRVESGLKTENKTLGHRRISHL